MDESKDRIVSRVLEGQDQERSQRIRAAVFELLQGHEQAAHGGEPCGMSRAGFLAWLAHSLGLGTAHLQKIMACIASYEADCPCGVPTLREEHFEHGE